MSGCLFTIVSQSFLATVAVLIRGNKTVRESADHFLWTTVGAVKSMPYVSTLGGFAELHQRNPTCEGVTLLAVHPISSRPHGTGVGHRAVWGSSPLNFTPDLPVMPDKGCPYPQGGSGSRLTICSADIFVC